MYVVNNWLVYGV